jgi:hypothetical protein
MVLDGEAMTQDSGVQTAEIAPGSPIEVRRRFDRGWARGFRVECHDDDGYVVRRESDGALLPVTFPAAEVRRPGRNVA